MLNMKGNHLNRPELHEKGSFLAENCKKLSLLVI